MDRFKILFWVVSFVAFICFSASTPWAMQAEEVAVYNFFEQLEKGDQDSILNSLTAPMLNKTRNIFSKNSEYLNFLHRTYADSSIIIKSNEPVGARKRKVFVEVYHSGDVLPVNMTFILKLKGNAWKISHQLFPDD